MYFPIEIVSFLGPMFVLGGVFLFLKGFLLIFTSHCRRTSFTIWNQFPWKVTQLLVSSDGGYLVTAAADTNVHVYNMADTWQFIGKMVEKPLGWYP